MQLAWRSLTGSLEPDEVLRLDPACDPAEVEHELGVGDDARVVDLGMGGDDAHEVGALELLVEVDRALAELREPEKKGAKRTRGVAESSCEDRLSRSIAMTATGSPPLPGLTVCIASDRS